ncbi:MAG: thioredoxin family protein, partial [bacterium]|nr:thioredoxin family protein [bacterium]
MVENLKSLRSRRFLFWASKNLIPIAIIVAGLLIAGVLVYLNKGKVKILPPQQAAEKAINYINQNLLTEGTTASLVNVAEENGVYKFRLKIGNQEYDSYVTKDAKLLFAEAINLETQPQKSPQTTGTIGDFLVSKDEICKEDGKPIVYFFGSSSCPHCKWEHPIFEKVAKNFEGYISLHNNMDSEQDRDIFEKYSTGGIPTLVFGCKYYRVGSGEGRGEEE